MAAPCGLLVPWPGILPMSSALGAWSLNHWTAREMSSKSKFNTHFLSHASHISSVQIATWRTVQVYNIYISAEISSQKPFHECLTWKEKIIPMYFGVIVLSPASAELLVPIGSLFYAPSDLRFLMQWVSLLDSVLPFSLRWPCCCSTEGFEVVSRNPLNFLSLYLFMCLCLPPFLLSQEMCPFVPWLIQVCKYFGGICYVVGTFPGT